MQRVSPRAFLLSVAGIGALVAGLLVVFMLMGSSTAPKAQAIVPTKTVVATATPKPTNNAGGPLSGLFDACAGGPVTGPCTYNPSPANTLYACMVRTDEDTTITGGEQLLKSSLSCGSAAVITVGGPMPPCGLWHGPGPQGTNPVTQTVAGEGNCGASPIVNGPTSLAPYKLNGFYCQSGPCTAPDTSSVPTDGTWQIGCLADFGTALGPNVVVVVTSTNATANNPAVDASTPPGAQNATVYTAATNAQCSTAQAGGFPGGLGANLPLVTTLTRRATTRVYTGVGTCTDMDKLWQNKQGSATKCPQDPFNPYAVGNGSTDVSGPWSLTAEAVRADVGVPGLYYNCRADIQQAVKNLTARIICVINSTGITVNPQVASGNPAVGVFSCPPAGAKFCGSGNVGGPPGCSGIDPTSSPPNTCATLAGQGSGCPSLPCDTSQYQFADIDNKETVLTGVVDNTANTMNLSGCFISDPPEGDGLGALGNVYVQAKINIHTGAGEAAVYAAQAHDSCVAGTPLTGTPVIAQIASVRDAPGAHTGACTPNVGVGYSNCRDSDGDGCPDARELADTKSTGGLRDPENPWDYFNPEKVGTPHSQGGADISYIVTHYNKNQGNAAYTIDSDRTGILGANSWNAGPPDGKVSGQDITVAVNQYNQNC